MKTGVSIPSCLEISPNPMHICNRKCSTFQTVLLKFCYDFKSSFWFWMNCKFEASYLKNGVSHIACREEPPTVSCVRS